MGNYSSSLDFIEFFTKTSTSIYEIVGPLYKKGLSITDISEQTGLKRNSMWNALQSYKQELRTPNSVPFTRWRKGRGKMGSRPQYGFCYFEGEVIKSIIKRSKDGSTEYLVSNKNSKNKKQNSTEV